MTRSVPEANLVPSATVSDASAALRRPYKFTVPVVYVNTKFEVVGVYQVREGGKGEVSEERER